MNTTTAATHTIDAPHGRRRIVSILVYPSNSSVRVCRKAPINNYKVRWYYDVSEHILARLGAYRPPSVRQGGQSSTV